MLIQSFKANKSGRDLAVGDIHGNFTKLQTALDRIGFDPAADRLFSVGDLVDRGPESELALEWLDKPWFHAVQGNHEDMAIRWGMPDCRMDPDCYLMNGGGWNIANIQAERTRFSDAFQFMPLAIEVETEAGTVGVVHADCPFDSWQDLRNALSSGKLSNREMKDLRETLLWDRSRIERGNRRGVQDVLAVVCGHTPVQQILVLGNVHYIDTGAWHSAYGREFVFLDLATLAKVEPVAEAA